MGVKLASVFDNKYTKNNNSTHLDGAIKDYKVLQDCYSYII